jgi:hypothetical protein
VGPSPAHGTYRGLDLELLDPGDEDERTMLIEVLHLEFADALHGEDDVIVNGETVNPRRITPVREVADTLLRPLIARADPPLWSVIL